MIHLVIRQPAPYQVYLCRELDKGFAGLFVAWFGQGSSNELPFIKFGDFQFESHYLDQEGYFSLARHLWSDKAAVIILGGWSSSMTFPTLLIASVLRRPIFIWLDHPHPRKRGMLFAILRRTYLYILDKLVAGFLACGTPTVNHLLAIGLRNQNIVCFPYWVSIPSRKENFKTSYFGASAQLLRLLAVGRHVKVKQFDTAIETLARVNENNGSRVAELVLVGDGPERNTLESLSSTLGCSESVKFTGWLSNEQVYDEIQKCDAVMITSSFEPYGVILLEAMAAGKIVLASEGVIGAQDRNDRSGAILLHPVGNSEYLAMQIQDLARNRDRLAIGSSSARRIAEEWPPERAVSILNQLFLNTKRGRMLTAILASKLDSMMPGQR